MEKKSNKYFIMIMNIIFLLINIYFISYILDNLERHNEIKKEIKNNLTDYSTFDFFNFQDLKEYNIEWEIYPKVDFIEQDLNNKEKFFLDKENFKIIFPNIKIYCDEDYLRGEGFINNANIMSLMPVDKYIKNKEEFCNKGLIINYEKRDIDFNKPLYVFLNGKIQRININENFKKEDKIIIYYGVFGIKELYLKDVIN